MEPDVSLPHSQVLATCPCPKPAQSSSRLPARHPFLRLQRHQSGLFPSGFPAKTLWNLRSVLRCLRRSNRLITVRFSVFCNISFCSEKLLAARPTPKPGIHPLSVVRNILFNITAATPSVSGGRLLHQQPQNAPRRGDRRSTKYCCKSKIKSKTTMRNFEVKSENLTYAYPSPYFRTQK
jgi:hypothetical protein